MKKRLLIIGAIIIITLIFGCTSTTEPNEEQKLIGIVTNAENAPVENAKIILSYYTESINYRPSTSIWFNLPNTSNVEVWISHHNDIDTVKLLNNNILEAGYHSITWDGTNEEGLFIVSNIYDCHIQADGYSSKKVIAFLRNNYSATGNEVVNYESLDSSDKNGEFNINYEYLPLFSNDFTFEQYNDEGVVIDTLRILNYVKIWALHQDYLPTFVDSVLLNEHTTTESLLKFQ